MAIGNFAGAVFKSYTRSNMFGKFGGLTRDGYVGRSRLSRVSDALVNDLGRLLNVHQ
jgi:hypothetical protein